MEEFSARMEEIAAKVEALTARMDALSPSLPRTDSQRSPPSQTAALKPFSFSFPFSTSTKDFNLPRQSQPTTSIVTPPNPVSYGTSGKDGSATLFGHLPLRTGSAQSQTIISSPPPKFLFASAGTDFALPKLSQITGDGVVPPRSSSFVPLRDSPQTPNTAQTPSPYPSQSQDSRSSVHSQILGDIPSLPRPSSLGSSRKDSGSSKSPQHMNDVAAAIAADFTQLSIKHSQAVSAAISADSAELLVSPLPKATGIPPQSATTQEIPTASFRIEQPRISYSSYRCNNEAWIRHRLIDSKEPIMFVGESKNRSLPVALAIMRESWDGIWASSLDKAETQSLPALLVSAQENSQIKAGRFKKSSPWKSIPEMRHKLSELTNALDPESHDQVAARLSFVVDATRLEISIQGPTRIRGPTRNIWFQCPWIPRGSWRTTAKLLEGFIFSAATIQKSGDAVFLGLTAKTDYSREYHLDDLKKFARRLGYEIFMDEWFILHAIDAGYKHESEVKDIHQYLIDDHQTFVFVKREHSEHTSVKEQISTQRKELEVRREELEAQRKELEAQQRELELHLSDLRGREQELSLVDETMSK